MNTFELRNWIENNNVEEKTKIKFWNYLNNYLKEEPELFYDQFGNIDKQLIEVKVTKIALTIVNWPYDFLNDCVISYADVIYEDERIAVYKLVFNLVGEVIDDYLVKE